MRDKTHIQDNRPSTAFTQKWNFMEERGDTAIDVRQQMIKDLKHFIKSLTTQLHEVVLSIDANEDFDPKGNELLL